MLHIASAIVVILGTAMPYAALFVRRALMGFVWLLTDVYATMGLPDHHAPNASHRYLVVAITQHVNS